MKIESLPDAYVIEGTPYTRVTRPLGLLSTPALELWRLRIGELPANRISKKAAEQGTLLHTYCQEFGKSIHNALDIHAKNPKHTRILISALNWYNESVKTCLASETVVFNSECEIAGRLDLFAELKDGSLWVIDYKTGRVRPTAQLQLAAYVKMLPSLDLKIDLTRQINRAILSINPRNKSAKFIPIPAHQLDADWRAYQNLLGIYRWTLINKL